MVSEQQPPRNPGCRLPTVARRLRYFMPCRFDYNCFWGGLASIEMFLLRLVIQCSECRQLNTLRPVHSVGCEAGSLYCSEWTLNASLTISSSLRKCSRHRTSGPSVQAMSLLRIEDMMKPSPTVRGSGYGRTLVSAAGPRTRCSQKLSDSRVTSTRFR